MYSDCGGQNRNEVLATAILSFLTRSTNLVKVTQKYFETSHSQMECDSMYSTIERAAQNTDVELPSDCIELMKLAKKNGRPYMVTELCHDDIRNFSDLNNSAMLTNAFKGIINVNQINYAKSTDGRADPIITMSDEIGGEEREVKYRKRGGQRNLANVGNAYNSPPGISSANKCDLMSMVEHMSNKYIPKLLLL